MQHDLARLCSKRVGAALEELVPTNTRKKSCNPVAEAPRRPSGVSGNSVAKRLGVVALATRHGLAGCVALVIVCATSSAFADVASWMYAGGGASSVSAAGGPGVTRSALQLDAGFGSSPEAAWVVGGILRTMTHFEGGTDLALCQRTTSGGFARGDWGLALDLGGYQRFWGPDSSGGTATLWGGGPWGLQLGLSGALGSNGGQMVALTVGLDWARATAHRRSGSGWWRNYILPLPSER